MKKIGKYGTALLLLSSMLLASCGSQTTETGSVDTQKESAETTEAVTEEAGFLDSVPALDFGGATFRISTHDVYPYEMDCESETGEITNDAVYARNRAMEERFNVVIHQDIVDGAHDAQPTYVKKCVMAGEDAFDMAILLTYKGGTGVLEGCFVNWYNLPYVNLENSWWANNINDAFTVNGKLYTAVSDLCVTSMQLTYAYLFNKTLAATYCDDSLYDVVDAGKWTLDYLYALTKDVYRDTNGDGNADAGDVYGLITDMDTSLDAYFPSCGQRILVPNDDGFDIVITTERAVNIFEKVNTLVNENPGAYRIYHGTGDQKYEDKYPMFAADGGLLMPTRLVALYDQLRDMKSDFGVLPFPKYDEQQEQYYSYALDDYSLLCVPVTTPNTEMVGALVEALSAESKKSVMPAYYQTALQDKYSRDAKSVEMLDLIMDGRTYDISILFGDTLSNLPYVVRNTVRGEKDFVSTLEKNMTKYEKGAATVYEKLNALS